MGKRIYTNTDKNWRMASLGDMLRWQRERRGKKKDLTWTVPQAGPEKRIGFWSETAKPQLVWVGHSTFVIRTAGLTVLTDPVWARRMGVARRLSSPGIELEELPAVDVVLISHGHYDHLDVPTLRKLKGDPLLLVPAGLRAMLVRKGFGRTEELDWWESRSVQGVEFTFVPAQHWTRRTLRDTNTSHWGGWMIRQPGGVEARAGQYEPAMADGGPAREAGEAPEARQQDQRVPADAEVRPTRAGDAVDLDVRLKAEGDAVHTIYFAGDSGYFDGFREIGLRFPDIDCALMPIGAYEPEWFMSPQHVSPEEAVQAFLDTGARTFVPMHYGAFRLADDTPKEALDRLLADWEKRGLTRERLLVPAQGEPFHI